MVSLNEPQIIIDFYEAMVLYKDWSFKDSYVLVVMDLCLLGFLVEQRVLSIVSYVYYDRKALHMASLRYT